MGHDIHFLQRLERVSTPQVDLALAMYRDPGLMAYLFARISLPTGADRVALALEDGPDSPHVIIARDGKFITCLGAGMSVNDLPVITRSQFDLAQNEVAKLREAVASVRERSERDKLFERLMNDARHVTREDFRVLSFLYPLMHMQMWRTTMELNDRIMQFRESYHPRRYRSLSPRARKELHRYWKNVWALGHHLTLHGEHVDMFLDALDKVAPVYDINVMIALPWPGMRTLSVPVALRGAWAMARAGRRVLADSKQFYEGMRTYMEMFTAVLSLVAIGLRHRRLRAEVSKVLARRNSPIFDSERGLPEMSDMATALVSYMETVLEIDEEMQQIHRFLGAKMSMFGTNHLPEGHRLRFDRVEDVPDDIAFWMPLNMDGNLLGDGLQLEFLGRILPWLAHAKAEDLYLPEAIIRDYKLPWNAQDTREQLDSFWQLNRAHNDGVRVQPKPGRNDPCLCGSGKKYKHCCYS